jgi:hypothetical protein
MTAAIPSAGINVRIALDALQRLGDHGIPMPRAESAEVGGKAGSV